LETPETSFYSGGIMKVGYLVRHVEIKEAIGIITKVGHKEIKVLWHDGDHSWIVSRRMELV
jgi:hypothetical protein